MVKVELNIKKITSKLRVAGVQTTIYVNSSQVNIYYRIVVINILTKFRHLSIQFAFQKWWKKIEVKVG